MDLRTKIQTASLLIVLADTEYQKTMCPFQFKSHATFLQDVSWRICEGFLKAGFFSSKYPSISRSIKPQLFEHSNETSWIFAALNVTYHILSSSNVFLRPNAALRLSEFIAEVRRFITFWVESSIFSTSKYFYMINQEDYWRKGVRPGIEPWGSSWLWCPLIYTHR